MTVTQRQIAYEWIRQKLIRGILSAGDRLSPAALAREIGVSHIPVREAISQLQSEGLVVQLPRRGAFVKTPDRAELVELVELRGVLECHAAARAARRIKDTELDELEGRLNQLRELSDEIRSASANDLLPPLGRWMLTDLAFHMVLLRAAGNRRIVKVIEDTHVMTHMFGYRADHPGGWADMSAFVADNYAVHRDVYTAVRRHDVEAARHAMAVHMARARKNTLARFDWVHQPHDADDPLVSDFPDSLRQIVRDIERRSSEEPPASADAARGAEE